MYRVAYEEGVRAVDDQIAELDSMRQRSVQFLAFVGSATAFLVGTGLGGAARTPAFYAVAATATVLALFSLTMVAFILLSIECRHGLHRVLWNFRLEPSTLVEKWIDPDVGAASESEYYRALALQYDKMSAENDGPLKTVRRWYWLFLLLGSTQVMLWASLVWAFA